MHSTAAGAMFAMFSSLVILATILANVSNPVLTTTCGGLSTDKDLTGPVSSVSDLLSKVKDGKVTVVVNTASSPDGYLTGTVSAA